VDRAEATAALPACPTPPPTTPPASGSPGPSGSPGASPRPTGSRPGATPTCTTPGKPPVNDNLLAAQQQLNNAKLTLTMAQAKLAGTVVSAPIAGRVLSVGGKVGQRESPGGTGFIVLGDISNLAVSAQFSEADVGRLAVGQVTAITLPHET